VPIHDAAIELRLSVDAVRRRIRSGAIASRQRKRGRGTAYIVEVAVDERGTPIAAAEPPPMAAPRETAPQPAVVLAELVRELTDRAERHAAAAAMWQARAEMLGYDRALPTPQESAISRDSEGVAVRTPETSTVSVERGFWPRLAARWRHSAVAG
jgi:hypothetical protein